MNLFLISENPELPRLFVGEISAKKISRCILRLDSNLTKLSEHQHADNF